MAWSDAIAMTGAVIQADAASIAHHAARVEANWGAGCSAEIVRVLHLFLGFPRCVLAFNALASVVPAEARHTEPDEQAGEDRFGEFYGADAEKVLPHLKQLDPVFASWIVQHAYGKVLSRRQLELAHVERLALLCLAQTQCWKQWESHFAIAQRIGVSTAQMNEDLECAWSWLGSPARESLQQRLQSA